MNILFRASVSKMCPKVIASLLHNISAYHRSQGRRHFQIVEGTYIVVQQYLWRVVLALLFKNVDTPNPKTFRFSYIKCHSTIIHTYYTLFIVVCSQFEVIITRTVQSTHETETTNFSGLCSSLLMGGKIIKQTAVQRNSQYFNVYILAHTGN